MDDNLQKRVNLRGFIQLDEMENFLSHLINKIHKQDAIINQLQELCNGFVSKIDIQGNFNRFEDILTSLSNRVEMAEKKCTSLIDNKRVSVGEVASNNYEQIQRLKNQIDSLITKAETYSLINSLEDNHNQNIQKFYNWATPLDLTSKIQHQQSDLTKRLIGMESMLTFKVDRTEITDLELLSTRLREYDSFRHTTEVFLKSLCKDTEEINKKTHDYRQDAIALTQKVVDIQSNLSQFVPKTIYVSLERNVNEILKQITSLASKELVSQMQLRLSECESMDSKLDIELKRYGERQQEIDAILPTKAAKSDLKLFVLRKHYEEAVTSLGSLVDTKALDCDLEETKKLLQNLAADVENEKKKLTVALRFVDWFVDRGVSYEHNMKVLDKHIENLAKANHPSLRQPYSDQIRFTPIPK